MEKMGILSPDKVAENGLTTLLDDISMDLEILGTQPLTTIPFHSVHNYYRGRRVF